MISIASAAVGAAGGYAGGKAQARGTVDGVKLQLSGQRSDALWEREVEACTLFIDQTNQSLFHVGQAVAIVQLDRSAADSLSIYGIGSRDDILRDLRTSQNEVMLRLTSLRLRVPSEISEHAQRAGKALTFTVDALYRWSAARSVSAPDEDDRKRTLDARLNDLHAEISAFTNHAREWLARPHPDVTE